jgi:WD40 repeat protein
MEGHTGEIRALAVSPDGRTLCSGGDDKTIKTWNASDGAVGGGFLICDAIQSKPDRCPSCCGRLEGTPAA